MENLPNPEPAHPSETSQLESLTHIVLSTLVLVIILSGTFNIFLWRQLRYEQKDLEVLRPYANQIVGEYNSEFPRMREFITRLTEFGRTNPDFVPILTKYGQQPTNLPPAVSPIKAPTVKK